MNDEKIFKEYVEQIIQSVLYTASLEAAEEKVSHLLKEYSDKVWAAARKDFARCLIEKLQPIAED